MSDILDRYQPALSATSDMPGAPAIPEEPAPTPVDTPAPEPEPVPDQVDEPDVSASITPAEEPAPEAAPEPKGVGKALAAKDAAIAAAEKARLAAEQRAEAAIRAMEALTQRLPQPAAEPPAPEQTLDPRPGREQFNSPEEYDTALIEWAGRAYARGEQSESKRLAEENRKAEEAKAQQARQEQENQKILLEWNERRAKAVEKYYDYAEVAERTDVAITPVMARRIVEKHQNGPDIAYYLGKNPVEASRIAALHPEDQIAEIQLLSSKLAIPKPDISKAPPPIRPVRSSVASANEKSFDDMSMEEYAAKRQPQIDASRRRSGPASILH